LPQFLRRPPRVPARLRLSGQREPAGLGARRRRARHRRGVQGPDDRAGRLAHRRDGVRRDAAESRESRHPRRDDARQMGAPGARDRLRARRERAADAARHDERHGRDARGGRRAERADVRDGLRARHGHPRDGHGADGPRSAHVGAERVESGLGRAERVRHRRRVHAVVRLPEPVVDVHGVDGAGGELRRRRAEPAQSVSGRMIESRVPDEAKEKTMPEEAKPAERTAARLWTRREAIERVSMLLGGAALVGHSAMLAGCATPPRTDDERAGTSAAALFSDEEIALLDEVADTILPGTSTPGAKAAGVGPFIALMIADTYTERDQRVFKAGLRTLDDESLAAYGVAFIAARPAERLALLERLDAEQVAYMRTRAPDQPAHY